MAAFIASLLVWKLENVRDRVRSAIQASTFIVLILALGYYGFRVWRILLTSSNPDPKLHGISPLRLSVATVHIMVIYLSRAVYVIVSDIITSFSLYFGTAGENTTSEILAAGYMTIWEIVPTIVILILFWGVRASECVYVCMCVCGAYGYGERRKVRTGRRRREQKKKAKKKKRKNLCIFIYLVFSKRLFLFRN